MLAKERESVTTGSIIIRELSRPLRVARSIERSINPLHARANASLTPRRIDTVIASTRKPEGREKKKKKINK